MNGTTRCPYCETRFKIAQAQLNAHQGMVRCGHCLQAFDARPNYLAEEPSPQLDLPIDEMPAVVPMAEQGETDTVESIAPDNAPDEPVTEQTVDLNEHPAVTPDSSPAEEDKLDFSQIHAFTAPAMGSVAKPPAPQEYIAHPSAQYEVREEEIILPTSVTPRAWPWVTGIITLALLLVSQSVYFYRVSLAAHLPVLKPALLTYCQLLNCTVSLPQRSELISIESSSLDADATRPEQITLNALLHNRANYSQAFPVLALTLNDNQDKPLARRLFLPKDYLPSNENELTGLLANHEINVKLRLRTIELKAAGYRLELFYNPIQ